MILGGGVPKNFNLQPEPALGQVLGLPDVQRLSLRCANHRAPVTDGSLSSCPPAEAVTWGKVDKDTYLQTTESMQADYSMVMPFIVKALLDKRARLAQQAQAEGAENLLERLPEARGFLRPAGGYRLFEQRERLTAKLTEELKKNGSWLLESLKFPIAI